MEPPARAAFDGAQEHGRAALWAGRSAGIPSLFLLGLNALFGKILGEASFVTETLESLGYLPLKHANYARTEYEQGVGIGAFRLYVK